MVNELCHAHLELMAQGFLSEIDGTNTVDRAMSQAAIVPELDMSSMHPASDKSIK